jgi:tRNA-specific 2-thiouridylase
VGALDKSAVREEARRLGLAVAEKRDSQEICFVAPGEHPEFVARRADVPAGQIRDREGHVLGRHEGVHRFTIGQRKGLGLSTGIPLYVVDIDAESAAVTVGPRDALERDTLTASRVNWIGGDTPSGPIRAHARIRHRHLEAAATITAIDESKAHVAFAEPQTAVTPGQAVVFYDGDVVLGGGWID